MQFCGTKTCGECPWRRDAPVGLFPPERFQKLRSTVPPPGEDGLLPIFACHKSPAGEEQACVGYLLVVGYANIAVRLAAVRNAFVMEELTSDGPLFDSYDQVLEVHT